MSPGPTRFYDFCKSCTGSGELLCETQAYQLSLSRSTKCFYRLTHVCAPCVTLAFAETKTQSQLVHACAWVALARICGIKVVHGYNNYAVLFDHLFDHGVVGAYVLFGGSTFECEYRKEPAVWDGPTKVLWVLSEFSLQCAEQDLSVSR